MAPLGDLHKALQITCIRKVGGETIDYVANWPPSGHSS